MMFILVPAESVNARVVITLLFYDMTLSTDSNTTVSFFPLNL